MTDLFGTSPSPDHVSLRGPHLSIGRPSCGGEYHRRARCGKTARRDLCGGCRVTGSPTAIPTACSVEKTDVLFSLTPGFSQVNWDTQLILKSVKRFLTLAAAAITWLKPGVNDS